MLTEAEIKTLVVEGQVVHKQSGPPSDDGMQRLTRQLARRVEGLEERYAEPLPNLERDVAAFTAKVESHLKRIGVLTA